MTTPENENIQSNELTTFLLMEVPVGGLDKRTNESLKLDVNYKLLFLLVPFD